MLKRCNVMIKILKNPDQIHTHVQRADTPYLEQTDHPMYKAVSLSQCIQYKCTHCPACKIACTVSCELWLDTIPAACAPNLDLLNKYKE